MNDWMSGLKHRGVYYEWWVEDVKQVLGIHGRATVTPYGT